MQDNFSRSEAKKTVEAALFVSARALSIDELAKITGHRDPRMLMRYYHPRAEDLAKKLG